MGLYFGTRSFADAPKNKVSNGTDAEYDEVSGCLAFESHEHHLGFISVSKQCARAFVDEERADTARHTSQSGNVAASRGTYRPLRVDVGRWDW